MHLSKPDLREQAVTGVTQMAKCVSDTDLQVTLFLKVLVLIMKQTFHATTSLRI